MNETEIDLRGLKCPLPILRAKKALAALESGDVLTVYATDAGAPQDFAAFCRQTGHTLLENSEENQTFRIVIRRK